MPVPIADIDEYAINALPPNKRLTKFVVWFQALVSMLTRLMNIFGWYMNGSIDVGYWDSTVTYGINMRVRTLFGVYESLQDANLNNAVSDTDWWIKINDSFIGATERASYTSQKLTYEKALNTWFGTMFRQPTSIDPGVGYLPLSDIYITTDAITAGSMVIYPSADDSDHIYPGYSTGWIFPTPTYVASTTYQFTIHIPVAVYTALGATAAIRESIVRGFADRLLPVGLFYNISTY